MSKWRVTVMWDWEGDAEDEGDALMMADMHFNLMSEARAEEVEGEDDEQPNG